MVTDYADYGQAIAEAFKKYLKTGEIKEIEGYSAKELKVAISRLSPFYNHNKQWYREVERRIEELDSLHQAKQGHKIEVNKKWLERIITFALGALFVVLIQSL